MNVEVAHKLSHHERDAGRGERWQEIAEIIEVVMLAVVAVATAWSGFQAAKWDSNQSLLYGRASTLRFEADAASTRGGQELVADSAGFNTWLTAHYGHDVPLMNDIVRRFTPDYREAFNAWLKTDPFSSPKSPPGPAYMPGYANPSMTKAAELNDEASKKFAEGTEARENADKYVRDTVLFASVLFLIAMAQRLKNRGPKLALNIVAGVILVFVIISVAVLPRA